MRRRARYWFRSRRLSGLSENLLPTAPKELVAAQGDAQVTSDASAAASVLSIGVGIGAPDVAATPATPSVFPWWLAPPARDPANYSTTNFPAPAASGDWFAQLQHKTFTEPAVHATG